MNTGTVTGPLERIVGRLRDDVEIACRAFYGERWLTMEQESARRWMADALAATGLQADAARGRYVIRNAEWRRHDGRTYMDVLVPPGSDLSCKAMREDALDAAIAQDQQPNAALSGPADKA